MLTGLLMKLFTADWFDDQLHGWPCFVQNNRIFYSRKIGVRYCSPLTFSA